MKIIELNCGDSGKKIFINFYLVSSFIAGNIEGTIISFDDGYCIVKETPEEILKLLNL
jgi:hypothetical protein